MCAPVVPATVADGHFEIVTKNAKWEDDLLTFFKNLKAQIFTVVMDKTEHKAKYPVQTFDPYVYCLFVLLWRVRGYCKVNSGTVDVLAESRGKVEDRQIQETYRHLKNYGSFRYGTAEEYSTAFPADTLLFRRKEHNIAGLQIADLVAFGQKGLALMDARKQLPRPLTSFTDQLNQTISGMVNDYGRYVLN